jgi:tetratricopeptide (TPR) repeat protein
MNQANNIVFEELAKYITERTQERTRDFTGRNWVFKAINNWLADSNGSRYFIITGKPGSGKSAISSQLFRFAHREISPSSNLDCLTPDFLSAIHFCSVPPVRWIRPDGLIQSLALQLANRYPAYAEALIERSSNGKIDIEVNQKIGEIKESRVIGVTINNLEIGKLPTEDAFVLTIQEPLETFLDKDLEQQIVILVDGLDESLDYSGPVNIVDLLSQADDLPERVRFILTSRSETEVLEPLRFSNPQECNLTSDSGLTSSLEDIKEYVWELLNKHPQILEKLSLGLLPETLVMAIQKKSDGNFLYVSYLLNMLASHDGVITPESLEELPNGLDDIYIQFLRKLIGKDRNAWKVYVPVLGTLAVAQEALTEEQLANFTGIRTGEMRGILIKLGQFLDADESQPESKRTYSIYHRSLADFLLNRDRAKGYWCEAQAQHQRILDFYKGGSQSWTEVNWVKAQDDYAFRYLVYHLRQAEQQEELAVLLTSSPAWMEAKFKVYGNDASYFNDLELAISDYKTSLEPVQLLRLTQFHTSLHLVRQRFRRYDDVDLKNLVWLERETEAMNYVRLRPEAETKCKALLSMHEVLQVKGQCNPSLINEAWEVLKKSRNASSELLGQVAIALAQVGQFTDAQQAVSRIYYSDTTRAKVLIQLAIVLTKVSQKSLARVIFKAAEQIAQTLSDRQQAEQTEISKELAVALAEVEYFDEAERVARTIENGTFRAKALLLLANALSKAAQGARASSLLTEVKQVIQTNIEDVVRAELLPELVSALIWNGQEVEARVVLAEVREVAQAIQDIVTRTEALRELIPALNQLHQLTEARDILTEATKLTQTIENDKDRARALRKLAIALTQNDQQTEAEKVFTEAEQAAAKILWSPDRAWALRKLVDAFVQMNKFTEAEQIAQKIEYPEESIAAFSEIATTLVKLECFNEAEQMTKRISNSQIRVGVLKELISALAQFGQTEQASAVFAEVEQVKARQDVFLEQQSTVQELINVLIETNHFIEAEKIAERIEAISFQSVLLTKLVDTLSQKGNFTEASRVAGKIKDNFYQAEALNTVAAALVLAENAEQGREILTEIERLVQKIESSRFKANTLSKFGVTLVLMGQEVQARIIFNESEQIVQKIEDSLEWSYAFEPLIISLIQVGYLDEAVRIVQENPLATRGDRGWGNALQQLISSLIHEKNFAQLEKLAGAIHDDKEKYRILAALATAMLRENHFTEVEQIAKAIKKKKRRVGVLSELAAAFARFGQEEKARLIFSEAEQLVRTINKSDSRRQALEKLVDEMIRTNYFTEVEKLLLTFEEYGWQSQMLIKLVMALAQSNRLIEAEQTATEINDVSQRSSALSWLSIALAQTDQFTEAKRVVEKIETGLYRDRSLCELVIALAQLERFSEAEQVAQTIEEESYRAKAWSKLVAALVEFGHEGQAGSILLLLEEAIQSITSGEVSIELAITLAQAGKTSQAKVLFKVAEVAFNNYIPSLRIMNLDRLVSTLAQVGYLTEAVQLEQHYFGRTRNLEMLGNALAQTDRFGEALSVLSSIQLNDFLAILVRWRQIFEEVEPGLSVTVIRDAVRIVSWIHPGWKKVHEALS